MRDTDRKLGQDAPDKHSRADRTTLRKREEADRRQQLEGWADDREIAEATHRRNRTRRPATADTTVQASTPDAHTGVSRPSDVWFPLAASATEPLSGTHRLGIINILFDNSAGADNKIINPPTGGGSSPRTSIHPRKSAPRASRA